MWLLKLIRDLQEDRQSRVNFRSAARRNSLGSPDIKMRFHLEYIKRDIEDFKEEFGQNKLLDKLY